MYLIELISNLWKPWEPIDLYYKVLYKLFKDDLLALSTDAEFKREIAHLDKSTETVDKSITFLPSLLHPLSHHEITSPIYRGELQVIETLISKFLEELKSLDIPNKIKCSSLESRTRLRIRYTIDNATGHFSFYYLRTIEPLLLTRDNAGNVLISSTKCFIEGCHGENNGNEVPNSRYNFTDEQKSHSDNNFILIWQSYNMIHNRITQYPLIGIFPQDAIYLNAIDFLDQQGIYQPINNAIVW